MSVVLCLIAMSGSFKPCPVKVQTIILPLEILPCLISCKAPVTEVADAGSQKTPSAEASSFLSTQYFFI